MKNDGKNILILSSWYPTDAQPFLGNFIERQAQLLSRSHSVTVVVANVNTKLKKLKLTQNDSKGFTEIKVEHPAAKSLLGKRQMQKKALLKAFAQIPRPDLIIGNVLLPKGWHFVLARKYFKVPLFYVEHGSYFRKIPRKKWSWKNKYILRSVRKSADEIIAVSGFLKKDMTTLFPKREIRIIGNHVDEKLFTFQPKAKSYGTRFLHISTLDKSTKNPKGIIEAFRLLSGKDRDATLTIVSDEDYSEWQQLVSKYGMAGSVHFSGPLNWEEVPVFYHQADAFVLFSEYESFSIVLAEALSTGTPLITTKVGLAADLPDRLALFVRPDDVLGLAGAMQQMSSGKSFDQEELVEFGKQFHSDPILAKWNELIQKYVQ